MSQRLDQLIQLHQIKAEATQRAYQDLLNAKEQFNQNKSKHKQLLGYKEDYLQQVERLREEQASAKQVRNLIDFISHLDTALIQLNNHLTYLDKIKTKAEFYYKQERISEEGVIKMIERVKNSHIQRTGQKEKDEYALKQWYSKRIND